ncbi:MAG: hypothetical protein M3Y86_01675 [Verrucomicrobiota bacterium]|nr:hypothetical protein [Verrucomicrobiota bacterium]
MLILFLLEEEDFFFIPEELLEEPFFAAIWLLLLLVVDIVSFFAQEVRSAIPRRQAAELRMYFFILGRLTAPDNSAAARTASLFIR